MGRQDACAPGKGARRAVGGWAVGLVRDANVWLDLGMVLLCLGAFACVDHRIPERSARTSVITGSTSFSFGDGSTRLAERLPHPATRVPESAPVRWVLLAKAECPHCANEVACGTEVGREARRCSHCGQLVAWCTAPCPACDGSGWTTASSGTTFAALESQRLCPTCGGDGLIGNS